MAKILLVDDQPDVLKMLESVLKRRGHQTVAVKDAFAAMETLKAKSFEMVITDAKMPGGPSGFDLIATIRKDTKLKNLLFVMLTGRSEKKDVTQGIEVGVDGYIVKPFEPETFLKKIDEILKLKFHGNTPHELAVQEAAVVDFSVRVVALSALGLKLQSHHALAVGTTVDVQLPFLASLGWSKVQLEVKHSVSLEPKTGFLVMANFKNLSPQATQELHAWLEPRLNAKSA